MGAGGRGRGAPEGSRFESPPAPKLLGGAGAAPAPGASCGVAGPGPSKLRPGSGTGSRVLRLAPRGSEGSRSRGLRFLAPSGRRRGSEGSCSAALRMVIPPAAATRSGCAAAASPADAPLMAPVALNNTFGTHRRGSQNHLCNNFCTACYGGDNRKLSRSSRDVHTCRSGRRRIFGRQQAPALLGQAVHLDVPVVKHHCVRALRAHS